jgi:L-amino acid N-acyltransferase YncA
MASPGSPSPSPRSHGFVKLRDATDADADAIAEVHHASRVAALRHVVAAELFDLMTPKERRDRWREWLVSGMWYTVVGEDGGRVVGFCTVGPSRDPDVDPGVVAEMPTLYVHPSHWRRGVGRALCAAGVSHLAALGYRELSLWTLEANRNARLFYAALGFVPDGTTKTDDDPVPTGLVVMRLRFDLTGR